MKGVGRTHAHGREAKEVVWYPTNAIYTLHLVRPQNSRFDPINSQVTM
jgi:hypothetical protein